MAIRESNQSNAALHSCMTGDRGWLANALDRESCGQGSSLGCGRIEDLIRSSDSTLVGTR